MEALTFDLGGSTAFFRKSDVTGGYHFSYEHIHKVALLGIFGAILGYGGYSQQGEEEFPEFYRRLNTLRVAILPKVPGSFYYKNQYFNNATGHGNKNSSLMMNEVWLENVDWKIVVMADESEEYADLKERLFTSKFVYLPYLGRNDHYAVADNVSIANVEELDETTRIHSLFEKKGEFWFEESGTFNLNGTTRGFRFNYFLPVGLDAEFNLYETKEFTYTNRLIEEIGDVEVFELQMEDEKIYNISFI